MQTPIGRCALAVVALGAASTLTATLLASGQQDARQAARPEVDRPIVQSAPERPTPAPDEVTDQPQSAARRAAREDLPAGARPTRQLIGPQLARRTAKRFALALLRRERDPDSPAAAQAIRAAATPPLADFVLAQRARSPAAGARPAPARLVQIRLSGSGRRQATVVVSISRGTQTAALLMQLVNRGGRWRVGGLG